MVTSALPVDRHVKFEQVQIRPLHLTDGNGIRRWMRDPTLVRFTVLVPSADCEPQLPYGDETANRYLRTLVNDATRRSFAIELDGQHVGNVGLKDLDLNKRTSECFVEIGENAARGRGVATHAMKRLLDLALFEMELVSVTLGVFEFNVAAARLYRRLGFRDDGSYGRHWADGRFWDVLRMCIEPETWAFSRDEVR